ncbi:MAG: hypothetical protein IPH18_09170 [Chitinophagaceae bacterium]|nr:hypothetical protein [Chitinophagaceae bacterium]
MGVSSIIVDPANSNVIYAGTGEVYRVDSSNIGFNVWKCRGTYGIGIIKSTDGGTTWTQVMTKTTSQLFAIQMLKFDPTNSNTIYACATDGLYRSTNNGTSWSQILSKIYVSDVAINPTNTNQIVVGVGNMVNADKGIYRTTNGSNASPAWSKIAGGFLHHLMDILEWIMWELRGYMHQLGVLEVTSYIFLLILGLPGLLKIPLPIVISNIGFLIH